MPLDKSFRNVPCPLLPGTDGVGGQINRFPSTTPLRARSYFDSCEDGGALEGLLGFLSNVCVAIVWGSGGFVFIGIRVSGVKRSPRMMASLVLASPDVEARSLPIVDAIIHDCS